MEVSFLIDEDFINYKKPSMFIGFPHCTFKCGEEYCQNKELAEKETDFIFMDEICDRYVKNDMTSAIVCGGLEPFESFDDLILFLGMLRTSFKCDDDFVIYTGYEEDEIADKVEQLALYPNVIVKYGRYIPGNGRHMDDVLGVSLASDNQYAVKVS